MTVTARSLSNYQVQISAGNHSFISDEPLGIGDDLGPDPYALLLSALGSCVVITLHMYARRKGWPLDSVEIELDIHQDEPQKNGSDPRSAQRVAVIEKQITFNGELSPVQIRRLLEIAERCPVQRTLMGEIRIESHLKTPAN
jgi:putative redox protein